MMKKTILLSLFLLALFSQGCRVAKKDWVKENFSQKTETNQTKQTLEQSLETLKREMSETINQKVTSLSQSTSESTTTNESETTTVTGTLTAEDGKEKSVTVGGTTITSNGANISFETSSSKKLIKEYQSEIQALTSELSDIRTENVQMSQELNSLKSEFALFRSTYTSDKETQSKTVKKTGFKFGFWVVLIIVLIVVGMLRYFRKQISFFS